MSLINWIEVKLKEKDIEFIRNNDVFTITTLNNRQFLVLILERQTLTKQYLETLLNSRTGINFIIRDQNLHFDNSVHEFLKEKLIGYGVVGDIFALVNFSGSINKYLDRELSFFVKKLQEHTNVSDFRRVNDRAYIVERHNGKPLKIAVSKEYTFTDENLSKVLQRNPDVDLIYSSDPYSQNPGKFTINGREIEVVKLRQFLGMLNGFKL